MSEPPTFFHGTRRPFEKGGIVMPRNFHKGRETRAPIKPGRSRPAEADDWVYITTSEILAWAYAWSAVGRGRPRVLTVQPMSDVWSDPEHSPDMLAYRCEAARVLAVDLTPMITEAEALAGWQDA